MLLTVHIIYLLTSIAITVFVGRTLSSRGRVFLVAIFDGNERMADAVNMLLIVGFYLVNIAYVSLALRFGATVESLPQAVERLADKIGLVLVILGVMHFLNLLVLGTVGRRYINRHRPPLDITEFLD
ncbi:hypothetical protein [Thalassoroseus pseudoceratinae]|uniref:hypothetical protein n=1 Tax=Thalassoroseus pseudoceratinae TaxID=2713176 RepID=UPI00142035C7|nr:hypothetical protein [Thalassoroseus pseudoceratinae]